MFHLFDYLAKFTLRSGVTAHCDDFVDRLNRKYTICLLLICTAIISSKQYVGDPLSCFCPSHFTGAHVEYTNNICWISNVYYVPVHPKFSITPDVPESLTSDDTPMGQVQVVKVNNIIAYYPFILLVQALFFYFPYFFWKNIVNRSAYDISTLVNLARESQDNDRFECRKRIIKYILRHIGRAIDYYTSKEEFHDLRNRPKRQQTKHQSHVYDQNNTSTKQEQPHKLLKCKTIFYNFFSNFVIHDCTCSKFLFLIYLFTKLLYILNSLGQLLVLNRLITSDELNIETIKNTNDYSALLNQDDDYFHMVKSNLWLGLEFGYKSLSNLIQTGSLFSGKSRLLIFHSVIFCDFRIRSLGDRIHKHHVQCVAPILIFSEKIFTLLWFWLFILSLINIFNLIDWLLFFLFSRYRFYCFRKYFTTSSISTKFTKKNTTKQNIALSDLKEEEQTMEDHDTSSSHNQYYLNMDDFYAQDNDNLMKHVLDTQLELDYIFVIRILTKNVNEILTKELITTLFESYRNVVNYSEKLK